MFSVFEAVRFPYSLSLFTFVSLYLFFNYFGNNGEESAIF